MFRKELIILGVIACAVFAVVAGIASLAVSMVQRDASMVARDTLPGLVNAGEAIDRVHENWFNTLRLPRIESATARAKTIDIIDANSTGELWKRYSDAIADPHDSKLFQAMTGSRAAFLGFRSNYFGLVRAGRMDEAEEFFWKTLEPASKEYQRASRDLFVFNAEVGRQRADRIMAVSWWSPVAIGIFCVGVLLVGFFIGFKASLGAFSGGSTFDELRK